MLLWQIYLGGALVAATGASVAADLFSDPDVPTTSRTPVIVFAGVVWPVLLIGLLQMICIGGLAKAMSTALAPRHVSRRPAARYGGWINSNSRCKLRIRPSRFGPKADLHTDGDGVLAGLRLGPSVSSPAS